MRFQFSNLIKNDIGKGLFLYVLVVIKKSLSLVHNRWTILLLFPDDGQSQLDVHQIADIIEGARQL